MKIRRITDVNGLRCFRVDDKYTVNCLDNVWLCDCALIYNRDIKKECKHIVAVIKFLDKFIKK